MKLIKHKHNAYRPGLIARDELGIIQSKFIDKITDNLLLKHYRNDRGWSQILVVLQEMDIAVGTTAIESAGRTEF